MKWEVLVIFLFLPSVFATSIINVPPLEDRDIVLSPGLHKTYALPVGGAELIDVAISTPPALSDYVTIEDPAPHTGGRVVTLIIDIPRDAQIPPGIYSLSFSANEVPRNAGQISTSVSVSIGFILRAYSHDPYLEIQNVQIPPTPKGERANFSIGIISRTTQEIPSERAVLEVLDNEGNVLASGTANHGALESGGTTVLEGRLDTRNLEGGIYQTRATVTYNGPEQVYNTAILRIGTLTIDIDDYTKSLTFNQTNKFQFTLKSNWNKPLTNVLSKVTILDQTKASAPVEIVPFGKSDMIEVYFDRTDTPPGPVNGTLSVTYQEKNSDPSLQEKMQTHTFIIPLHLDVVMPPVPAKVHTPWRPTTLQIVVTISVLLILANIIILLLVLRRKKE